VKIFFDHITGKLTNYDLLYSLPLAEFEESEYDYAFNNGWLPLSWYYTKINHLTWINARSSRLQLSEFTFSKKQKYTLNKKDIYVNTYDKLPWHLEDDIANIYKKYIQHKNYYEVNNEKESEEFMRDDPIDWKYFVYYYKERPIAFTEAMMVDDHFMTGQFAWDYENEKLGMGTYASLYEIKYCMDWNYKYYYFSYSYENSSIYKSKYDGFEFWTGRDWCKDKEIYNQLCKNDSNIKDLADLNDNQQKYFDLVFGTHT